MSNYARAFLDEYYRVRRELERYCDEHGKDIERINELEDVLRDAGFKCSRDESGEFWTKETSTAAIQKILNTEKD